MKDCVTHHYACYCREEKIKDLMLFALLAKAKLDHHNLTDDILRDEYKKVANYFARDLDGHEGLI